MSFVYSELLKVTPMSGEENLISSINEYSIYRILKCPTCCCMSVCDNSFFENHTYVCPYCTCKHTNVVRDTIGTFDPITKEFCDC